MSKKMTKKNIEQLQQDLKEVRIVARTLVGGARGFLTALHRSDVPIMVPIAETLYLIGRLDRMERILDK
jgi:hypothetical protein